MLYVKRVYEPATPKDGARILVDRLWPRGLTKERADLDDWFRDLAPSETLRQWFGHDPRRFAAFEERYKRELELEPARTLVHELARRAGNGTVTIVFAAKDPEHNNAVVLSRVVAAASTSAARRTARAGTSTKSPPRARHIERGTASSKPPRRRRASAH